MESFYLIVSAIAVGILILSLTAVSIMMGQRNKSQTYPNAKTPCPDYWTASDTGECMIPAKNRVNTGKLYDVTGISLTTNVINDTPGLSADYTKINFEDKKWIATGQSSICGIKSWAAKNKVVWDTVTNTNVC